MTPGSEPIAVEPVGHRTHPASAVVSAWLWLLGGAAAMLHRIGTDSTVRENLVVAGVVLGGALLLGVGFGLVRWMYTRYVIDGCELRIDSGVVVKQSRRVPYERLQSVDIAQPLGARVLGLAELRIEMAGGGQSRTTLAFLTRSDAERLREVLLDKSQSDAAPVLDGAPLQESADAAGNGRALVATVPITRLVGSLVLSTEFLLTAAIAVLTVAATVVLTVVVGGPPFAYAPLFLALVSAMYRLVVNRVVSQWGFSLARAPQGVRIERGLTSRSSQTIPRGRVQGIAIEQPLLWRSHDWRRLVVDVAGYGATGRGDDDSDRPAASTLLPVADKVAAGAVLTELMPAADPDAVSLHRAPSPSRWFAPVGWRYLAAGADDHVFVTCKGWLTRRTDIVPHAKTQSVALRQGPLERILGLATVVVHSPDGPVKAQGRHLAEADARVLAADQLQRARSARVTR